MTDSIDMARLVVRLDADITRLEAGMARAVNRAKHTAHEIERSGIGEALSNIMSTSRARILEQGGESLGVLSSGLESIGPAGIAAAASVGMMAAAVERAVQASEWAEQLEHTASALHITTDQLQELNHVATASGVPLEAMHTSLMSLSEALGRAQSPGTLGRRTQRLFDALGIDASQIAQIRDVNQLLPVMADALHRLSESSPAEAQSIGQRLGIDPVLLRSLEEGRGRIDELTQAAHDLGLVIDESLVRGGAEAADKMRELHEVVGAQLTRAFVELAPIIGDVASAMAHAAHYIADFVQVVGDGIRPVVALANAIANLQPPSWLISPGFADRLRLLISIMPGGSVAQNLIAMGGAMRARDANNARINGVGSTDDAELRGQAVGGNPYGNRGTAHPGGYGSGGDLGGGSGGARRASGGRVASTPSIHISTPTPTDVMSGEFGQFARQYGGVSSLEDLLAAWQAYQDYQAGGGTRTIDTNGIVTVSDFTRPMDQAHEQLVQQWQGVIQGGLEAAIHGGWRGLAQYMAQELERSLINGLSSTLANIFTPNAISGGGGGGIGSFIASLFTQAPKFASGGLTPGGPVWVGEYGKELVNLPRGSQVLNHATSMGGMPSRGGQVVNQTINLHADGAVLAGELVQHLQSFSIQAAGMAFNGARVTIPQDLQRRAMRRIG